MIKNLKSEIENIVKEGHENYKNNSQKLIDAITLQRESEMAAFNKSVDENFNLIMDNLLTNIKKSASLGHNSVIVLSWSNHNNVLATVAKKLIEELSKENISAKLNESTVMTGVDEWDYVYDVTVYFK